MGQKGLYIKVLATVDMQRGDQEYYGKLLKAVLSLNGEDECRMFFEDIFTKTELDSLVQRLKVADMLYKKNTCGVIAEATGASTATVSRVNRCLNYGPGGYKLVLDRLNEDAKK